MQGFVPDFAHGAVLVPGWQAGEPKKSFLGIIKTKRKEAVPIGAFRCSKCGFLEFYADAKFAASRVGK